MSAECGGQLQATDSIAWVTAPSCSGHICGNLDCDWIITAQADNSIVNLQVIIVQGPVVQN